MAERDEQTKPGKKPPLIFLGIGVSILVVAAVIFSAAGPDRSRTELKNSNPSSVNPRDSGTSDSKIPNVDMPTAPKSR